MGAPTVTVLLPVRDCEATVERAVKDVLRQSERSLELLVIDDGSHDGTRAILAGLAASDARMRVLDGGGKGVVHAINLGLAQAQGRFLARMDADDQCHPERLAVSLAALEADPELSGVGTQVELFRDDRPVSPSLQAYGRWLNSLTTCEALFADRLVESPLCNPSVTFRREALEWAGGWREGDFPEDWELFLRLLESGRRLRCVEQVLFSWRDHDRRVTWTDPRYGREAHLKLKAQYLAPLLKAPVTMIGAGEIGLKLSKLLATPVQRFVDLNPRKIGQTIHGAKVVPPSELGPPRGYAIAAVGTVGAREEIRGLLKANGWLEGRDFTCVA